MAHTHALILAGGSGTRFWPASRRDRPKQLLALTGGEILLRQTLERIAPLCGREHVQVATGRHLVEATLAAMPELSRSQLLVEPVARNTAPCIGWAAAVVARSDPDAVVMVFPSDQHVSDAEAFRETVARAVDHAQTGVITTIGIRPTRAETGYGYIEAALGPGPVHRVARYLEKPDRATAEKLYASGKHWWNAGMFFFRARDMLAAIEQHLPALAEGLAALDAGAAEGRELEVAARVFPGLPAISIDHGVIEQVSELAVVPGDFGWSDVGSWLAAAELAERDVDDNDAPAGSVLVDARRNHVVDARPIGPRRVIALVGVSDLVVVETDDALLVVHRDATQRVREVVDQLRERGDDDLV
jgi:mannose-1-phosphate guanylyltransferase